MTSETSLVRSSSSRKPLAARVGLVSLGVSAFCLVVRPVFTCGGSIGAGSVDGTEVVGTPKRAERTTAERNGAALLKSYRVS